MSNARLTTAEKIDFLLREKNEQRVEILEINRTSFKTLFAFLTLLGVFAGIYLNENVFKNPEARTGVLFVLSQLQFLAVVFEISIASLQNVHVGYVRALEKRINRLAKCNISVWDTHVALEYIVKPKGAFFISQVVLSLFYLGGFATVAFVCWRHFSNIGVLFLYAVEVFTALVLFALSMTDAPRAEKLARRLLEVDSKRSSNNELQGDSVNDAVPRRR